MVSDSAYNLFYRRRGYIDLNEIDYDKVRQRVDPAIEAQILNKNNK